jgi:hypothetical protein
MPRVYLPLLPLPVLSVLVAVSACSKPRSEQVSHVIPPAAPYVAAAAVPTPPPPPPVAAADEAPTAEEVKAFERPVRK